MHSNNQQYQTQKIIPAWLQKDNSYYGIEQEHTLYSPYGHASFGNFCPKLQTPYVIAQTSTGHSPRVRSSFPLLHLRTRKSLEVEPVASILVVGRRLRPKSTPIFVSDLFSNSKASDRSRKKKRPRAVRENREKVWIGAKADQALLRTYDAVLEPPLRNANWEVCRCRGGTGCATHVCLKHVG